MTSEQKASNEERKSPLVVSGKAPLDVLLDLLGMSQKLFCREMDDMDTSTYRGWRAGKPPRLSVSQAKKLDALLRQAGLGGIQDLPDDLTRRK